MQKAPVQFATKALHLNVQLLTWNMCVHVHAKLEYRNYVVQPTTVHVNAFSFAPLHHSDSYSSLWDTPAEAGMKGTSSP